MKHFQLYVRSGCHLCEAMEEELSALIAGAKTRPQVQIERIYIDNDETLTKLYGERIPVLMVDKKVLCEYFLDPVAINPILIQDSQSASSRF